MSLENPNNQNLKSENMEHDVPTFGIHDETFCLSEKGQDEIDKDPNKYFAREITESYALHANAVGNELAKIKQYLDAKKNRPLVERQLEEKLFEGVPSSNTTIQEKLIQLERYRLIIGFFEKNQIPQEVLRHTKIALENLTTQYYTYLHLEEVAINTPELN